MSIHDINCIALYDIPFYTSYSPSSMTTPNFILLLVVVLSGFPPSAFQGSHAQESGYRGRQNQILNLLGSCPGSTCVFRSEIFFKPNDLSHNYINPISGVLTYYKYGGTHRVNISFYLAPLFNTAIVEIFKAL